MTEYDEHEERAPLLTVDPESGRSAHTTKAPTPVPWTRLSILLLLNSVAPLAFELIFPFINQMLLELKIIDDPAEAGFYSGVIESLYSCFSFLTIIPCSYASDRVGRKPIILFGTAGLAVSIVSFGLSRTYFSLILSRCLGGALGGSWSAIKIMIGELTDRSNQSIAFTGLTMSYRMGQILGLPLGGYLSHPERHAPILFGSAFWLNYPFLLPCLVGAAIALIGVILGTVFIEETLPSKRLKKAAVVTAQQTYGGVTSDVPAIPSLSNEREHVETSDVPPSPQSTTSSINTRVEEEARPTFMSLLSPRIVSLLVTSTLMCLSSELLFSIYPLFAFTPIPLGGLGLSEAQIGTHLSVRAILHIGTMFLFTPLHRLTGRESAVKIYQFSMLCWPITAGFYPLLGWMARRGVGTEWSVDGWVFNLVLGIFFFIWSFAGFGWTASGIMVNDAAPSAAALGAINGVFQMSVILPQAIAPAASTSLFAISIQNQQIAGGNLVWIVLVVFAVIGAIQALTLQEEDTDWRKDAAAKNNIIDEQRQQ